MPIYWISGPPAAGKSTLAENLVNRFERGVIIPVDDIREWVKIGQAGPSPWTDETEKQYRVAEEAACLAAGHYSRAGFAVIIDACRSPKRVDEVIAKFLADLGVEKVILLPELETNLNRAHTRLNKDFDSHFLDDIIEYTNRAYKTDLPAGWLGLDNSTMTVEEEVDQVLAATTLT